MAPDRVSGSLLWGHCLWVRQQGEIYRALRNQMWPTTAICGRRPGRNRIVPAPPHPHRQP
jgi:hypothetical protein